jgi:hypothetical protein
MGLLDIFTHRYEIRAKVEMENGEIYKIKCPIEARFVDKGDIINAVKRETEFQIGVRVKHIIEFYDANQV